MAEFPALPLWTDAYLGDTTHLTTFEHGAYLLLLMVAWRSPGARLPDDDVLLARYARMTRDKWRKTRPVLAPFFRISDGHWNQRRLQDELRHLQSRRAQQSEAGRASVKAKSLKRTHRGVTDVEPTLQRTANEPSTPTPTPSTVPKGTGATAPPVDPIKALFDAGVALLTSAGVAERPARSIIGKWRKAQGDSWTREAIAAAAGMSDPVAWIEARKKATVSADDEAAAIQRARIERYRNMDMPGPPASTTAERALS